MTSGKGTFSRLIMTSLSSAQEINSRKTAIIPIFLPGIGCPQRCIFCNQEIATDTSQILNPEQLEQQVECCLAGLNRAKYDRVEVAFYGGSFTGLAVERQRQYLEVLCSFIEQAEVNSIRVSTRPDFLDAERLSLLKKYGVRVVEIGAQSMDDEVLKTARRGYTAHAVREVASLVHKFGFALGIHLMLGLPGDTVDKALWSGDEVIKLRPRFVRIHPTLVLRDTELARLYKEGKYSPWAPEEVIQTAKELLRRFKSAGIRVARIGLQPSAGLLQPSNVIAGYNHPALKEICESELFFEEMERLLLDCSAQEITFVVNPRDISKALGHKKENLKKIERLFIGKKIFIRTDSEIPQGKITILGD